MPDDLEFDTCAPPRLARSLRTWRFMRLVLASCVALLAVLLSSPAAALTKPISGAYALPKGVKLPLPFPAGAKIKILSGYGPNMGSGLHKDTNKTGKANDHYALDLIYADKPNAGKGLPIVAPLAGKVVRAGWATVGWANYGLRVILEHNLGDGHKYHSIYCHMNKIVVKEGETVAVGQALGELGGSCQGKLSCSSFGTPHLHWALHRDSSIGGSGTGGSYGGNAVVPELLDGAEDLYQGMVITSTNTGMPKCGDGWCNGNETPATCPKDCPVCEAIPAGGRVVEESESLCFKQLGTPKYWNQESTGHGGKLFWTTATDDAKPDNVGRWLFDFKQGGTYLLEVYTKAGFGMAKKAKYQVKHGSGSDSVTIDQSAVDGWQKLGTYAFNKGGGQQLELADNTGEPLSLKRKLVFDAVRLTSQGGSSSSSSSTSSSGTSSSSTSGSGEGGSGQSSSGSMGGGTSSGMGGFDGSGGYAPGGISGDGLDGGCSCRTAPARPGWPAVGALLLGLAALMRRRRD